MIFLFPRWDMLISWRVIMLFLFGIWMPYRVARTLAHSGSRISIREAVFNLHDIHCLVIFVWQDPRHISELH